MSLPVSSFRTLSHRLGEAWTVVAENYGYGLSAKSTIPSEIIELVFERKVRD